MFKRLRLPAILLALAFALSMAPTAQAADQHGSLTKIHHYPLFATDASGRYHTYDLVHSTVFHWAIQGDTRYYRPAFSIASITELGVPKPYIVATHAVPTFRRFPYPEGAEIWRREYDRTHGAGVTTTTYNYIAVPFTRDSYWIRDYLFMTVRLPAGYQYCGCASQHNVEGQRTGTFKGRNDYY